MLQRAVRPEVRRKCLTTREEKQRVYTGFVERLVRRPKEEQDNLWMLLPVPRLQSLQTEGQRQSKGYKPSTDSESEAYSRVKP